MPRLEFVVMKANCLLAVESCFVSQLQFSFDLGDRPAELLAGCSADSIDPVLTDLRWLQCRHGERVRGQSIDQESQVGGELWQVHQVAFGHVAAELLREHFGVLCSDLETKHGADVTEDGRACGIVQLIQELMRQHERCPVLAAFGEDRCERTVAITDEVLKLIDGDAEVGTLGFGNLGVTWHTASVDVTDARCSRARGWLFSSSNPVNST